MYTLCVCIPYNCTVHGAELTNISLLVILCIIVYVTNKILNLESTTIWNLLRKKETTGVLSNTPRMGRSRNTSAVDDRNIVTAVKKDPKTTVSDISINLQRAGVKVSQSTVRRRLHEQKYRGYTRRCKPLVSKKNRRRASKILGQGFMDWFYGPKWWKG